MISHSRKCSGVEVTLSQKPSNSNDLFFNIQLPVTLPTFEEVCHLNFPTLRFIPSKSRPAFAKALSSALRCVISENTEEAWLKFCILPKCLLPSTKRGGHHEKLKPIDFLCNLWANNDLTCLRNLAKGRANKLRDAPVKNLNTPGKPVDMAVSFGKCGMLGKACRTLLSSSTAPNNDTTCQLLKAKNPVSETSIIPSVHSGSILLDSSIDIGAVLTSLPKATAAGLSAENCSKAKVLFTALVEVAEADLHVAVSLLHICGFGSASNRHLLSAISKFNALVSPTEAITVESVLSSSLAQHALCKMLDDHLFQSILMTSSPANKARLLSSSASQASSWLSVVPSLVCPFCPNITLDPLGHHAVSCRHGGDVVIRHNRLRNIFAEFCRRAHLSVRVEFGQGLSRVQSISRPADVLVDACDRAKPAAFDVSVTSPLTPATLHDVCNSAGVAAHKTECRKHSSNDPKCQEPGGYVYLWQWNLMETGA
eukprot:Em0001g989a